MSKKEEKTAKEIANEVNTSESVETTSTPKTKPKMKVIVSGANFWDFTEESVFIGTYIRPVEREEDVTDKDGNIEHKKGDIMGYLFENSEDGEEHIIGNSHQIEKAVEMVKEDKDYTIEETVFYIEFLGKDTNSKGKPFNRFKIGIME